MFNLRKRAPTTSLAIEWRERSQSPRSSKPVPAPTKMLKQDTSRRSMDIEFDCTDENFVTIFNLGSSEELSGYFDLLDSKKVPIILNPIYNDSKLLHRETASQFVSLVVQIMREHGLPMSEIKKRVKEDGFLEKAYLYLKELARHKYGLRSST